MASATYSIIGTAALNVRRVSLATALDGAQLEVDDIVENELCVPSDTKAYAAARRRLLRELDRQITEMLEGRIDEISLSVHPA